MIYPLYSVQDTLIGFNAPFIMVNENVAIREYKTKLQNTPNSEDMRLYQIGTFNDDTGEVTAIVPKQIAGGLNHE